MFHANIRKGRRHSSARAFLDKGILPANLRIFPNCIVRQLLWQKQKVTGVAIEQDGRSRELQSAEVVLSAGVYNTPKLLELSGVGDPRRLWKLNIPVVSPLLGVGENLQDHLNNVCRVRYC